MIPNLSPVTFCAFFLEHPVVAKYATQQQTEVAKNTKNMKLYVNDDDIIDLSK